MILGALGIGREMWDAIGPVGRYHGAMANHKDVVFLRRRFPSANMVLIKGPKPVLIDTGFGSDLDWTIGLLRGHGVAPDGLISP